MKICKGCKANKPESDYWKRAVNKDGLDDLCSHCKLKEREEREATPGGIYELKARLIVSFFRDSWGLPVVKGMALDHKFSIAAGYRLNVALHLISNKNNLRYLTARGNRIKGSRCSITLQELEETFWGDEKYMRVCSMIEKQNNPETLRRWGKLVREKEKHE